MLKVLERGWNTLIRLRILFFRIIQHKKILPKFSAVTTCKAILFYFYYRYLLSKYTSHRVGLLLLVLWSYSHWVEYTDFEILEVLVNCSYNWAVLKFQNVGILRQSLRDYLAFSVFVGFNLRISMRLDWFLLDSLVQCSNSVRITLHADCMNCLLAARMITLGSENTSNIFVLVTMHSPVHTRDVLLLNNLTFLFSNNLSIVNLNSLFDCI
jgi:hypothetical protein